MNTNFSNFFTFSLLSLTLVMCSRAELPTEAGTADIQTFSLTISSEEVDVPSTKTYIEASSEEGRYDAMWHSGDEMQIYVDDVSSTAGHKYTLVNGTAGRTASFVGSVGTNEGGHRIYGFYPSSALVGGSDSYQEGNYTVSVDVPSRQTPPSLTSFDPACDLLAAAPMDVSFTSGQSACVSGARFSRKMAILKLVPYDATSDGTLAEDKVLMVKMSSGNGTTLTGRARLDLLSSEITSWTSQSSCNYALASYTSESCFGVNGSNAAYIMVAPGTLACNDKLSFEICTDSHLVTKDVTLSSDVDMPAGTVTTMRLKVNDDCVQSCGDALPLVDDFSSASKGDNTSTSGCSNAWDGDENFPASGNVKAYQAGGAVKLGTGSYSGCITTKALNLALPFTVSFKVKGWSSVEGDVVVTAGSQSRTVSYKSTMYDSFESVSVPFYAESALCNVTLATSEKRCFIDDVVISYGKDKEHAIVTSVGTISLAADNASSSSFTVVSDYSWTASPSDGSYGFTFEPSSGEGGASVSVSVKATSANTSTESRQLGGITFSDGTVSKTVSIFQNGKSSPSASGWAELPAATSGSNLELCKHSSLPSGSSLRNYSFLFDKNRHCSLWVAWPLHSCYMGSASRQDSFGYDPDFIINDYEANLCGAYYPQGGSSYSHARGHQMPSAERTVSASDNNTTFYATNMTPQLQDFNGGVWEELESLERSTYICQDTLYIVTGPYFDPSATPAYAYDNKGKGKACQVPTHYWKVFLRTKSGKSGKNVSECSASELICVGFWFKHQSRSGKPKSSDMKSVSEIEALTGFTFFPNVPNAPKSTYSASDWGL